MQPLIKYLPFIIAPFLFVEVAPFLRLVALISLCGICGINLVEEIGRRKHCDVPSRFFFPHLLILILAGVLDLTIMSAQYSHSVWPSLLSGALLMISLSGSQVGMLRGLCVTCVTLWGILLVHPLSAHILPYEHFQEIVNAQFPPVILAHEDLPFEIVKAEAIIAPRSHSVTILFHAAIVLTTAISFALAFSQRSLLPHWLRMSALLLWSILLLLYGGKFAFVLLAFNTILFFATGGYRSIFLRRTNQVALGIFLVFCLLGYLFDFTLLFTRMIQPYDVLRYFSPDILEIELVGTLSRGFQRITYSSFTTFLFSLLTLIVLFHIVLDEVLRRPSSDNWFPAVLSILFFIVVAIAEGFSFPSPLTLLAHPFLWLSVGILQNLRHIKLHEEYVSAVQFVYQPQSIAVVGIIISLWGMIYLTREWQAHLAFQQFANTLQVENQYQFSKNAFQWAKYRGDISAVFATALLQHSYYKRQLPAIQDMKSMDTALLISAQKGYIASLAYKRLRDIYLMYGFNDEALQTLQIAVRRFPDSLILREILAEQYEDMKMYRDALREYKICANLAPTSPYVRRKIALLYNRLAQSTEYIRAVENLRTIDPTATDPM